tara:strand:- start:841 stop:1062 length:222 start_codon:yes stop_codon:yes gene_type:complete
MTNLFKILSDLFDDDIELAEYIRMLGEIPDAQLELPDGFSVKWTVGEKNVYHAKERLSLEDILNGAGLKTSED